MAASPFSPFALRPVLTTSRNLLEVTERFDDWSVGSLIGAAD